jgi:hypothetical protein
MLGERGCLKVEKKRDLMFMSAGTPALYVLISLPRCHDDSTSETQGPQSYAACSSIQEHLHLQTFVHPPSDHMTVDGRCSRGRCKPHHAPLLTMHHMHHSPRHTSATRCPPPGTHLTVDDSCCMRNVWNSEGRFCFPASRTLLYAPSISHCSNWIACFTNGLS